MTSYPLPECRIGPGCDYEVSTRLETSSPFLPLWFTIPDEIAEHLLVTDLRIANRSLLFSTGCVPAGLFAESAARDADGRLVDVLQLPVVRAHQLVSLSLTNASDRPVAFRGSVVGCDPERAPDRPRSLLVGCGRYEMGPSPLPSMGPNTVRLNVRVRPQVELRPHKLYVPASVLEKVVISTISTEAEPGEMLSWVPNETVARINVRSREDIVFAPDPVVSSRHFIRLEAINQTKEPRWFSAAVLGTLVPDPPQNNPRMEHEQR
jgi:hypothetical protein